jgi:O-glycosyl hydrolase
MFGKSFCVCVFFVFILSSGTSYGDVNNILSNPGFENSTSDNWAARSCTFARTTSQKHSGSYSGLASGRTATWQGIQQNVLNKIVADQTYTVSGWVRTSTSASSAVHLTFQKTDGSGTTYAWGASGTASNSGWVYISGSYTLTANGTLTELLVYVEGPASGIDLYLDDANVFGLVPGTASTNATGDVNTMVRHQVLDGFGASGAWYEGTVLNYSEPTRTALYNTMFRDLGLDIYRVRNTYNIDNGYITRSATIIAAGEASLGHPIRVMNSSWSPQASLKSNDSTVGGTLKKDAGGLYMYDEFAQWWRDSLTAWTNAGVNTYYVNMQNEPDWTASWDTCYFKPIQTDANAGYEEAFAALYANLNSMPNRPKLLAPEGANISGTPGYVNALNATDKSNVYGYSHHLYDGSADAPDGFIGPMTTLKAAIGDRPLLQTEFSKGGPFTFTDEMNLAKLIHNALTIEEVTAYLYWELFWASPSGLVSLTTPTPTINSIYYAFKHYSYFTDPNWQRIDADTNSTNLRISAFIDPNNQKLSVIIINTSTTTDMNLTLSFSGFTVVDGNVWRSTSSQNCVLVGSFTPGNIMTVPANSITTLALSSFIPDTTPPEAPTGLTTERSIGTVVLDWNDNNESDLAGYNVYRSTTSGVDYNKLNSSLLSSSTYTDTNVVNGTTYFYIVTAVDTASNESDGSDEVSATPSDPAAGTGAILCEWWTGITGTAVSDLTLDVNYPDNSSGRELLTSMEGPTNWGDNYGNRIRGYLNPVTSGDYSFWIASDDNSELWLSTDDNPANISLIASVTGYTGSREWTKYPSQESSPILLTAGQKYYIEVLHKEGTGNDNVAVAWQGPGITQQVIDGMYLSPCCLEFGDFAGFANQWNLTGCNTGNDWCDGFDFNRDGSVLLDDLKVFTDGWLTGIE